MAIQAGQAVEVARDGGIQGTVEEVQPGQVLVRFESGERSWVPDSQVRRRTFSLRPSRTPATAPGVPPVASGVSGANVNPYGAPQSALGPAYEEDRIATYRQLLFSFEGRIGRSQYWKGTFLLLVPIVVLGALAAVPLFIFGRTAGDGSAGPPTGLAVVTGIFGIAMLLLMVPYCWASLALSVKRWHDHDKSGWWFLLSFVPYLGGLVSFVICGCLRGTRGPNRYGPDPV